MQNKIGFIGCGNMGGAILDGILKAQLIDKEMISIACQSEGSQQRLSERYGVFVSTDNQEVVKRSDVLILAVKPYLFEMVIKEMKDVVKDQLIVSVAAGVTMQQIQTYFDKEDMAIIRMMPNTPACVQEAMSSMSVNAFVREQQQHFIKCIFESFGKVVCVKETAIHDVIALSGSAPAYFFMMLDAMINYGVKQGVNYEDARLLASQAALGAAKMVRDSDIDANTLKQNVCSPNGTTIEAVQVLEKQGMKQLIETAMDACKLRSIEMSEE